MHLATNPYLYDTESCLNLIYSRINEQESTETIAISTIMINTEK